MSDFLIKKWYLDIADNKGNVFIGYWLSIRWKRFLIHGYQILQHSFEKGIRTRTEFTKIPEPFFDNRKKELLCSFKDIEVSWELSSNNIHETLIKNSKGKIKWSCLQPKTRAKFYSPNFSFDGLGYVELIEISVPVWKLPFESLYWGRCHTEKNYLVWIKFNGNENKEIIWHNNRRINNFKITDDVLVGKDFQLNFGKKYPLREGKISSTIFKPFGNILKVFPKTTFLADEHKFYSLGKLRTRQRMENAIIIYEKVLW